MTITGKPYACYKMCGSSVLVPISKIERNLISQCEFKCSQKDCEETVKYENYYSHLTQKCKNKIDADPEEEVRL